VSKGIREDLKVVWIGLLWVGLLLLLEFVLG